MGRITMKRIWKFGNPKSMAANSFENVHNGPVLF
jgi:hypothetical protein